MLFVQLFLLTVFCYQNVCTKRVLCDLSNSDCLTKGALRTYKELVGGDRRGMPSSDPLHEEIIVANLPTVNYTLRDTTLTGLRKCLPELIKINPDLTYDYYLACEHLSLKGQYEMNGNIGSMCVEGKGDCEIDAYDYVVIFHGEAEMSTDKDGKQLISAKRYKVETNPRGKIVYNFKNSYNGDEEKTAAMHKYLNENYKEMDQIIPQPIMDRFMVLLMINVNKFMKSVPMEHVFGYDV